MHCQLPVTFCVSSFLKKKKKKKLGWCKASLMFFFPISLSDVEKHYIQNMNHM